MSTETNERKKELRDAFIDARGYWNEFWDALLDLDEDFFEAYTRFSSVPWLSGLRQHIRNALDYGATREEVLEVIELASVIGIHSCTVGVPILVEELAAGKPAA